MGKCLHKCFEVFIDGLDLGHVRTRTKIKATSSTARATSTATMTVHVYNSEYRSILDHFPSIVYKG